jgi:tetratricopeptide (TPR) repeat protein
MVAGDRVRVTAQLIEAATDRHLWAQSYERELSDLLNIQSEVARSIAREIRVTLTPQEASRLATSRPADPRAYEAYLRGRFHWNRRNEEGVKKSLDYFQAALAIDPAYVMAHAGLADAYVTIGVNDYGFMRPRDAMAKAKEAAQRALELDPAMAGAHISLASVRLHHDWDFMGAEQDFERGLELNPNDATAHHWYAFYLAAVGRHEEALRHIEEAKLLDPLSLIINANVGWILFYARRYPEAVKKFRETLEMDPNFGVAGIYLALAYEQMGRPQDAVQELRKVIAASGMGVHLQAALGRTVALAGPKQQAQAILNELLSAAAQGYVPPHLIARVAGALGNNQRALEWLERAHEERVGDLIYLRVDPAFDSLRSDARFQALVSPIHFPR